MNNKKILLLDIDYTLFNTTAYKEAVAQKLAKLVPHLEPEKAYSVIEEVYYDVRSFGSFDPSLFADFFIKKFPGTISKETVEEIWWQKDTLIAALYPETVSVLQALSKKENLFIGIFSSGKTEFQLAKIAYLEDFFHKDDIHIASFKEETITELIAEYKDEKILLVDDYVEILATVKKQKPDATVIWMKRGRFAEKARIPEGFVPDAIIIQLDELVSLVDNS